MAGTNTLWGLDEPEPVDPGASGVTGRLGELLRYLRGPMVTADGQPAPRGLAAVQEFLRGATTLPDAGSAGSGQRLRDVELAAPRAFPPGHTRRSPGWGRHALDRRCLQVPPSR